MASARRNLPAQQESNSEPGALSANSSLRNIAYWESTLFSNVYLRNDLKRDFAELWAKDFDDAIFDENGDTVKSGFYHFYNEFRNIAKSLRGLSEKRLSETDTITKIITPLLDALGWYDKCANNVEEPFAAETSFTVKAVPKNKTFRTDMILVDEPQEAGFIGDPSDADKRKKEARQYCIAPLEAKYWNRIVDREKSGLTEDKKRADKGPDDTGGGTSYNEQILNYMSILHKKWGILTDGNIWRLLNNEVSSESPQRCFEFRMESLLDQELKIDATKSDEEEFLENAKYFYLFFGKASFIKDESGKIFLEEVLKESRKYIDCIEEDLKDRFISAMNITCEGLLKAAKAAGTITKPTADDMKLIRTVAESHLFNILFIKSCEARSVLPIKAPSYYDISLTCIFDRISVFEPEKFTSETERDYLNKKLTNSLKLHGYKPMGTSLYKNLIRLTEVIHDGATKDNFGFEIKGFKESVFSNAEWAFAKKHCLSDEEMVRVFFELGYSKASTAIQRNYQQIPYNYFTPRQLGSIYESFLEYKLDIAEEQMVYVQKGKYKQWIKLTVSVQRDLEGHEPIVMPGQAYFTPDNNERKATGSYYTPDYIVQYLVQDTLGPLCAGKSSAELLETKVCDPAMGSGHFLIGALNFLTTEYVRALEQELPAEALPSKVEAKRVVLDKCIFGVDLNPRAVKLAKMSLWLESAHWGKKLERLDDQLLEKDTLITKKIWDKYPSLDSQGFEAIIGNPPYSFGRDWETLGSNSNLKSFFQKEYPANSYQLDLYSLFMEKSFKLTKVGGRIGLIVPDAWAGNQFCAPLRKYIFTQSNSINLSVPKEVVFKGLSVDTILIVFSKNPDVQRKTLRLIDLENGVPGASTEIDLKKYLSGDERLPLSLSYHAGNGLNLDQFTHTIGDFCEMANGVRSYRTGGYGKSAFGKGSQTKKDVDERPYHSLNPKNGYRPFLYGKDMNRFSLKEPREYVKYGTWLAESKDPKFFEGDRLYVRKILGNRVVVCPEVGETSVVDQSIYICKPTIDIDIYGLAGLVGSRVIADYVRTYLDQDTQTFPQLKVNEVRGFPVPDLRKKEIKETVSEIGKLVKKLIKIYEREGVSNTVEPINQIEKEIDALVHRLYAGVQSRAA